MNESETLSHTEKTGSKFNSSISGFNSVECKLLELDMLYIKFEENFINNRTVLFILFAVSAVIAILSYLCKDMKNFAAFIIPTTVIMAWGFYKVIAGIIIAKSKMRTARKTQEILRAAVTLASRSLKS